MLTFEAVQPVSTVTPAPVAPTVAERFRKALPGLKHRDPQARLAAIECLGECGSDAILPLLDALDDEIDSVEVQDALAMRLADLIDGPIATKLEDELAVGRIFKQATTHPNYFTRLVLTDLLAQTTGGASGRTARTWLHHLDTPSRRAALRWLTLRIASLRAPDAKVSDAITAAERHWLRSMRREGAVLRQRYEAAASRFEPAAEPAAEDTQTLLTCGTLRERRAAAALAADLGSDSAPALLAALKDDPDRAVRHLAVVSLYRIFRTQSASLVKIAAKDREVEIVLAEITRTAEAGHGSGLSLAQRAECLPTLHRQRLIQLVAQLRPYVNGTLACELDEIIRNCLRHPDQAIRRAAQLGAKAATTEVIAVELTARLGECVRRERPMLQPFRLWAPLVAGSGVALVLTLVGHGPYAFTGMIVGHMLVILTCFRGGTAKYGMQPADYLDTLLALEAHAESRPERLREVEEPLRELSSRAAAVHPEVRTKARELLARMQAESSNLAVLPIVAVNAPEAADRLPVVAAGEDHSEAGGRS